jgi:hypothetical protein
VSVVRLAAPNRPPNIDQRPTQTQATHVQYIGLAPNPKGDNENVVSRIGAMSALVLISLAVAQTPAPTSSASRLRRFINSDGSFQFDYSRSLLRCDPERPTHACMGYFPPCDEHAIACFLYPSDEYQGYNFSWASFSVAALRDLNSEPKCLTEVDRNTCRSPHPERHSGMKFEAAQCGEGGLGHHAEHEIYRTYRHGTCYELSINVETTEFTNYPPGTAQKFSENDRQSVLRALRTSLETFAFRK